MLLCLLWFVAVCSCSGLWGSSFELRFVSSDDILAWVGHLRAMLWFQFQLFRFAIPVLSQSVSVPVVVVVVVDVFACWTKVLLDLPLMSGAFAGILWSMCGGWELPRHVDTCECTRSFKIFQHLRSGQWAVLVRRMWAATGLAVEKMFAERHS